jgi:hypothetical protein
MGSKKSVKKVVLFILCILLSGCSFVRDPDVVRRQYLDQIRDWQERVKHEGWTTELIDEVARQTALMSSYRGEEIDRWDTPNEFVDAGLCGDCEDIAAGIYGSYKRLGYPYDVRLVGVMAGFGDHALVKVQLPSGKWKTYETIYPWNSIVDWIFYRPFVEFNAYQIEASNSKEDDYFSPPQDLPDHIGRNDYANVDPPGSQENSGTKVPVEKTPDSAFFNTSFGSAVLVPSLP